MRSIGYFCKFFTAIILIGLTPGLAPAAWLGYKNETKAAVVVQTSVIVNGRIIRGKPYVLYPGEMAWDNIPAPGIRQIGVYDPKANNRLLHQDAIAVQNQDVFLALRFDAPPPTQPGKPAQPPQFRFLAVKAPSPPGVIPSKDAAKPAPVPPKSALPPTATPGPTTPPPADPKSKSH